MNKVSDMLEKRVFETPESMAQAVAEDIFSRLSQSIESRGEAVLVGAGGSTPKAVYQKLSSMPLEWSKVTATLGDERWVDAGHAASNEAMLKANLAKDAAKDVRILGMKTPHESPFEAQSAVEKKFRDLPKPYDVVMLGMGMDAHTASLFPGSKGLAEALDPQGTALCAAITPNPLPSEAPFPRMTLTLAGLSNAHHIMILVQGEQKRAVLEEALAGDDILAMPIRAVLLQKRTPVTIYLGE